MNMQQIIKNKLNSAMAECDQHHKWLHRALQEAVNFPALQPGSVADFTADEIRTLDQLVFRFGKLQDAIGMRLLPATLQLVQEWHDSDPFLDKLNRAEKLGILPSVQQWQQLRELRNQTAHEYPDQPEIVRANLRLLIDMIPELEQLHCQIAAWAQKHIGE